MQRQRTREALRAIGETALILSAGCIGMATALAALVSPLALAALAGFFLCGIGGVALLVIAERS